MSHPRRKRVEKRRGRHPPVVCESLEDRQLLTAGAADVTALQQHISSDHLVVQISQLAAVESTQPVVQSFAEGVISSHLSSERRSSRRPSSRGSFCRAGSPSRWTGRWPRI